MRKALLVVLLAATCVSVTGCGGCGSGMSEAADAPQVAEAAPEEATPAPPATIAKAPQAPPAKPKPLTPPEKPAETKTASTPAKETPKTAVAKPVKSPVPSGAAKPLLPVAATVPTGPIEVVIQNAAPAKPLTLEEKRLRSAANLRKLGEALLAHTKRTGALPATIQGGQGQPLLSWRVVLLPDLGYGELYRQFRLSEPWDSQHNSQLLAQIPPELQSPERFDGKTNYLGLAGSGQAFGGARGAAPAAMEDGAENTVVVVEVDDDRAVDWTAPSDFQPAAGAPRAGLGQLRADGVFALLGDGRVVRLGPEIPEHQLLALFSPDGGEPAAAAEALSEPAATPVQVVAAPALESILPAAPLPAGSDAGPSPSAAPTAPLAAAPALAGDTGAPATDPNLIAVPSEAELTAARELVRDLFGKQYEEARTWQDKAKFAQLLLTEADKIETNPAQHYELLRIARDVAASGGDVKTGLKATELLTKRFQVDGLALRLKLLDELSASPRKTESADSLKKEALQLLLDAFDGDNFDVALPAYERLGRVHAPQRRSHRNLAAHAAEAAAGSREASLRRRECRREDSSGESQRCRSQRDAGQVSVLRQESLARRPAAPGAGGRSQTPRRRYDRSGVQPLAAGYAFAGRSVLGDGQRLQAAVHARLAPAGGPLLPVGAEHAA